MGRRDPAGEWAGAVAKVKAHLGAGLPGHAPDLAPTPFDRPSVADARGEGCREAAALVLVYPRAGVATTVLTVRSQALRHHPGQVSFPGGALDRGEAVENCALREAHEELGVGPTAVEILGRLSPVYVPPSRFCLNPVLAVTDARPDFRPHPGEVSGLLEADLDRLAHPTAVRREVWRLGGRERKVPFYPVGGHKVWGATGLILSEVAALWQLVRSHSQ